MLALEIKFERELNLHGQGYDTDAIYDLPWSLKKTVHTCVVTAAAETSFHPMGYQRSGIPTWQNPIPLNGLLTSGF